MHRLLHSTRFVPALAAILALAACGDSTGPEKRPLSVALELSHGQAPVASAENGVPIMSCVIRVDATAAGSGKAEWRGGTLRFYIGSDLTEVADSVTLAAEEVRELWDRPDIEPGDLGGTALPIRWTIPYTIEVDLEYERLADRKRLSARDRIACAPPVPTGAAGPSLTSAAVTDPPRVYQPGDTIALSFTVDAPAGLWMSGVVLEGPCEKDILFADLLQTSASHVVKLIVPAQCRLGVPMTVTVYAFDAALRGVSREILTDGALQDVTRPTAGAALYTDPGGSALSPGLVGDFFVGDDLRMAVQAKDNVRLHSVHWWVPSLGIRDSMVLASGAEAARLVTIPTTGAPAGPLEIKVWARDSTGLTSDTARSAPGAVALRPTVNRPTRSIAAPGAVRAIALDARRGVVYAALQSVGAVVALSLGSGQVTATIDLPGAGADLDLTAGGDSLVVAVPAAQALAVIDLRASTPAAVMLPIADLGTGVGRSPASVRVLEGGRAFVGLTGGAVSGRLIEVNLATGAQRVRADAGTGGSFGGLSTDVGVPLERSGDRRVLVANGEAMDAARTSLTVCLQRYDVATDHFSACRTPAARATLPAVDAAGARVAAGQDLFDASLQPLRTPLVGGAGPIGLSPDGASLYVMHPWHGLLRYGTSDGRVVDRTRLPSGAPPGQLRVAADGSLLAISDAPLASPGRILLVDLR